MTATKPKPLPYRPAGMRTDSRPFMQGVRYALTNLMTADEARRRIDPLPTESGFRYIVAHERIGTKLDARRRVFLPEDLLILCQRRGWTYLEGGEDE